MRLRLATLVLVAGVAQADGQLRGDTHALGDHYYERCRVHRAAEKRRVAEACPDECCDVDYSPVCKEKATVAERRRQAEEARRTGIWGVGSSASMGRAYSPETEKSIFVSGAGRTSCICQRTCLAYVHELRRRESLR